MLGSQRESEDEKNDKTLFLCQSTSIYWIAVHARRIMCHISPRLGCMFLRDMCTSGQFGAKSQ